MNAQIATVHCYGATAADWTKEHADLLDGRKVVALDRSGFAEHIGDIEVLLCHTPPSDHWSRATRLRLIQTLSVGLDTLLPAPDLSEEVLICNTSGLSATAMGEFAVTQLLMLVKRFPQAIENQRQRTWRAVEPQGLGGRTVAVLGTGMVGREVARLLAPFGCRVIGVTRRARPIAGFAEVRALADLHEVLRAVDDVVIALPAVAETRHLVDRTALATMRPHGHLVNVARGDLIDEAALMESLSVGHLAGAALDTVADEPLAAESPLWTTPGLVVTPHVSWTMPSYSRDVIALFAENIAALESERPLRNVVDRGLGYHPLPDSSGR